MNHQNTLSVDDLCMSLACTRTHFDWRFCLIGNSTREIQTALTSLINQGSYVEKNVYHVQRRTENTAFLYSLSPVDIKAFRELCSSFPILKKFLHRSDQILKGCFATPLVAMEDPTTYEYPKTVQVVVQCALTDPMAGNRSTADTDRL